MVNCMSRKAARSQHIILTQSLSCAARNQHAVLRPPQDALHCKPCGCQTRCICVASVCMCACSSQQHAAVCGVCACVRAAASNMVCGSKPERPCEAGVGYRKPVCTKTCWVPCNTALRLGCPMHCRIQIQLSCCRATPGPLDMFRRWCVLFGDAD
jgi:hypothetical protein